MKNIKHLIAAGLMIGSATVNAQTFDKELYQKALWMTTRFYGAQRSGAGNNWLIADHEPTNTTSQTGSNLSAFVKGQDFVKDADGDYDLTGGWFDCGDNARFGQTEFYSAYMLLLGYSEFPAGYDDYYSADYIGYRTAKNYTWAGKNGTPNGIPDILDEVKYATDFFMKCVRDEGTFYYQVGDGDQDHAVWCTSPVKATLPVSSGGEADGSRPVTKATGNATSVAALCGSTLAAMSRLYKPFDSDYAAKCLEKALVAYKFVMNTAMGNSGAGGYYPSKSKYEPDIVIFCMELYRATGDDSYITKALSYANFMSDASGWNHNYTLCYNNTEDLAYYLLGMYADNDLAKTRLASYINDLYKPTSGYLLNKTYGGWGVLRFPANQAFVFGLYKKMEGELTSVDPYTLATVEYIMGSNSSNFSFIVGLTSNSPKHPHHRNYYGEDGNSESVCNSFSDIVELGYLVGGTLDGTYNDVEGEYTYSEGGIDYNAGLVGALGYVNSILNTVNTNKFGHPTPSLGDDQSICGQTSITLQSGVAADGKKVFTWTLDGAQVASSTSATDYVATKAGEYVCTIDSAGEWETTGSVKILDVLPDFDLVDEITLCNPSQVTLDATISAPVSYQWYLNGTEIADETAPTYTVYKAGTYKVVASATGCPEKSATVEVSSNLPAVSDVSSYSDGTVELVVSGEGEYEWYDAEEGGNLIGSGSKVVTKITQDSKFYVQDASSVAFVAGPSQTTFSGLSVADWGSIAAAFTAKKALMIKGVTVYVTNSYTTNAQTATFTLAGDASATAVSEAITVSGSGYYTLNLTTPIELAAGNYTLSVKGENFSMGFIQAGPAYSTYQNNGDVIEFTGASNGDASNNPFPMYVDWQIQAGSGCSRAMVLATYNPNGPTYTSAVDEVANSNAAISPNPVQDIMYVSLDSDANVEMINMLGAVVKSAALTEGDNLMNVSDLTPGVYMVRITSASNSAVVRIIKK